MAISPKKDIRNIDSQCYYSNENIEKYLLKKNNLRLIEDILDSEINKFQEFEREGHIKEEFQENFDTDRFLPILHDIYTRVNAFLGVNNVPEPGIYFGRDNEYSPTPRIVHLRCLPDIFMIPYAAHEYAHHVCEIKHYPKGSFFSEGFAISLSLIHI